MEEITELLNQAEEGAEFGKDQLHLLDTVVNSLVNVSTSSSLLNHSATQND